MLTILMWPSYHKVYICETAIPKCLSGKDPAYNVGETGHGFDTWKVAWRKKWQLIPLFLLGKPMDRGACGLQCMGVAKSQTWLSTHTPMKKDILCLVCLCVSCSVVSDSAQPHGLCPTRLLCPWDSPGKNTGVGCHVLLQGIFLAQGLNPSLLHWRWALYQLSPFYGKPILCLKYIHS